MTPVPRPAPRPATSPAAAGPARSRSAAGPEPVRHRGSLRRRLLVDESGAATAEYAVATMAAVGFAGLLIVILRGDEVRGILTDLVRRALTVG